MAAVAVVARANAAVDMRQKVNNLAMAGLYSVCISYMTTKAHMRTNTHTSHILMHVCRYFQLPNAWTKINLLRHYGGKYIPILLQQCGQVARENAIWAPGHFCKHLLMYKYYCHIEYKQLYIIYIYLYTTRFIVKIVKVCMQNLVLTCQPTSIAAPAVVAAATATIITVRNCHEWQINSHINVLSVCWANKYGIYTNTAVTRLVTQLFTVFLTQSFTQLVTQSFLYANYDWLVVISTRTCGTAMC